MNYLLVLTQKVVISDCEKEIVLFAGTALICVGGCDYKVLTGDNRDSVVTLPNKPLGESNGAINMDTGIIFVPRKGQDPAVYYAYFEEPSDGEKIFPKYREPYGDKPSYQGQMWELFPVFSRSSVQENWLNGAGKSKIPKAPPVRPIKLSVLQAMEEKIDNIEEFLKTTEGVIKQKIVCRKVYEEDPGAQYRRQGFSLEKSYQENKKIGEQYYYGFSWGEVSRALSAQKREVKVYETGVLLLDYEKEKGGRIYREQKTICLTIFRGLDNGFLRAVFSCK